MIGVVTSRSRNLHMRPMLGPYCLNQDCAQAEDLVAWYPLSGRGVDAHRDYAGRLNHLAPTGTMPVLPGPGSGFGLSNTASTSNYLTAPLVVTALPVTVAAWVLSFDIAAEWNVWNINTVSDDHRNLYINKASVGAGKVTAASNIGGGAEVLATATGAMVVNMWALVCGVWTSATLRAAYLNGGGKVTETTSNSPATPTQSSVGIYNGSGLYGPMQGAVTHLCIWNVAKDDAQVRALYDPETRWELYYPLGRKTYVFLGQEVGPLLPTWQREPPPVRQPRVTPIIHYH